MTHPLYSVFSDIIESMGYYAKISLLFVVLTITYEGKPSQVIPRTPTLRYGVLTKLPTYISTYISTYINSRMEGMPYFARSPTAQQRCSRNNLKGVTFESYGKYGSEIHDNLLSTKLGGTQIERVLTDGYCVSIETLRNYIESLNLPTHKTFHTFEDCLPTLEYAAVQYIKYSDICARILIVHPNHILVPIVSMNELYVSCLGADGSDRVFETPHIDGLFAWLPWCNVYRVVVSIQGNRHVNTVFPLSQNTYTLETGEYVAFDYNRSIHYICGTSPEPGSTLDTRKRIVLKLHYLVYPEWLPVWISRVYVAIHGNYNAFLRGLFLKSQITTLEKPEENEDETENESITQRWISAFINNGTTLYVKLFLFGLGRTPDAKR